MVQPLRARSRSTSPRSGRRTSQLAAEIADGWLPIFFSPDASRGLRPRLERRRGLRRLPRAVPVVDRRRPPGVRATRSSRARALHRRHGRAQAELLQRARSAGTATRPRRARSRSSTSAASKCERRPRCPDALVDEVALVGARERIADRLDAWRECGVTTLLVQTRDAAALQTMAELVL